MAAVSSRASRWKVKVAVPLESLQPLLLQGRGVVAVQSCQRPITPNRPGPEASRPPRRPMKPAAPRDPGMLIAAVPSSQAKLINHPHPPSRPGAQPSEPPAASVMARASNTPGRPPHQRRELAGPVELGEGRPHSVSHHHRISTTDSRQHVGACSPSSPRHSAPGPARRTPEHIRGAWRSALIWLLLTLGSWMARWGAFFEQVLADANGGRCAVSLVSGLEGKAQYGDPLAADRAEQPADHQPGRSVCCCQLLSSTTCCQ